MSGSHRIVILRVPSMGRYEWSPPLQTLDWYENGSRTISHTTFLDTVRNTYVGALSAAGRDLARHAAERSA